MASSLPDHVTKHSAELGLEKNWSVKKDFVDAFLKRHLPKGRLLKGEDEEIQNKYLMLDNTGVNKGKKQTRKKKTLSTRECRNLKIFKVEKEGQSYESYLPLHHLWLQYMEELTNFNSFTPNKMPNVQQRLLKADLHGSILTVQRSKCPSYVGVTGILLQETRNTFLLITKENKIKCIPKQHSVFTFLLGSYQFTIYGNNFRVRSSPGFKPNVMEWVINHMGHSLDIHKIHYRCTSDALEKTQIAKILLLQDNDRVEEFRGRSLQDIQIEDLIVQESSSSLMETEDNGIGENEPLDDEYEQNKTQKRKKASALSRKKWTTEKEENIKKHFRIVDNLKSANN